MNRFLPAALALCLGAPASADPPGQPPPLEEGLRLMKEGRYERALSPLQAAAQGKPVSPEALTQLGWAYLHTQKPDAAHRVWSQLVQTDPRNPAFLRLLARLELDRGAFGKAEELARRALESAPAEPALWLLLGRTLLAQKRLPEAGAALEKALDGPLPDAESRAELAEALAAAERPAQALIPLDRLLADDPESVPHRRRKAQLLRDLGRVEESGREWERLARRRPPDPEALLQLGWIRLAQGRTGEAGRHADTLVRLDGDHPAFLRLSANVELERENFERAAELSRRALERDPRDKESALVLVKALSRLGRREEALALIEQLMSAHPDNGAVRFGRADLLAQVGRAEEALASLEELLKLEPGNVSYRKRKAQILTDLDRVKEAEREWSRLAERRPPDLDALLQLGWIYVRTGRLEQAHRVAGRLVELQPSPAHLRFLAAIELERGDVSAALRWARAAHELAPEDKDSALTLVRALIADRRDEEGLALARTLAKRHPDDPSIWFGMAQLLAQVGKPEQSLPFYEKLLELDPENELWRRQRADALYLSGRYEEALKEWEALASKSPPDARAMRRLVEDAYNARRWERFFEWDRRLAALEPRDAADWTRAADALARTGRLSAALEAAEKVVELDPGSLDGLFMKAEFLELARDWRAASEAWGQARARNPSSRRAIDGQARMAAERGRFREALAIQAELEEQFPSAQAAPALALRKAAWLVELGELREALSIARALGRTRETAVPALLYRGLYPAERSDQLSSARFAEQLRALKAAGYETVGAAELAAWLKEGKPLPGKPLMISFDDARVDSFRLADPALKEAGYKAVMFAHAPGLSRQPMHAGPQELARWAASGRWELQAYSARAHAPVSVDAEGRTGRFFSNRRWQADKKRLETPAELRARLDSEYADSRALLQPLAPDSPVIAFSYPHGDFGQIGASNDPEAAALNRALAGRRFRLAFVQDAGGWNTRHTPETEWTRFEVPREMSGAELVEHLRAREPWVQARLAEARLWLRIDRPARALRIVDAVMKETGESSELLAQKGLVLEKLGQGYQAARLYERAAELTPGDNRYRELHRLAEIKYGRSLTGLWERFTDSEGRVNSRSLGRLGVPIRGAQLLGSYGRSSYGQGRDAGERRLEGDEFGAELRLFPDPRANLRASYERRRFDGAASRAFDVYGVQASLLAAPELRVNLGAENGHVASARGIDAGLRRDAREAGLEWQATTNVDAALRGDQVSFSDGNEQFDVRLELNRRMLSWLSLGYQFWYGDSRDDRPEYWSPSRMHQHLGQATITRSFGDARAKLGYGFGYGEDAGLRRSVQSARLGLEWTPVERLTLQLNAGYGHSPRYISRQLSAGATFRY